MRQHAIDLLPDSLRARAQAGMRARRYAAAFAGAIVLVVLLSIHSRWALASVSARLKVTEDQANLVLRCEAKAVELNQTLGKLHLFVQQYDHMVLPVQTSRILATISNEMPDSITLERLDLITKSNQAAKTPRSKSGESSVEASQPRMLMGELAGYAAAEQDIAGFVGSLESTAPFEDVSLNYIRTRKVNETVHEFCLSFRINLERHYEVVDQETPGAPGVPHSQDFANGRPPAGEQEVVHVRE